MNKIINERDNSIDILRFIGLSCIVLAHIGPPNLLYQLRTFDVPCMVFISGLAYAGRPIGSYIDFLKRRLFRLIVPVYIFLTCYFILRLVLVQLSFAPQITFTQIVGSFLLMSSPGIGYVWVIGVFLIIMLLTPLLVKIEKQIKSNWHFICLIAALFAGQFVLTQMVSLPQYTVVKLAGTYIFYLGYSIPFLVGLRLRNASTKKQWLHIAVIAIAFACIASYYYISEGKWLVMQKYKYPPQVYFLLWGTLISSLLWATREWWQRLLEWKWILFIAQNTIWIYLWHIPVVSLAWKFLANAGWLPRLIIVYGLAVFIVYMQSRLIDYIDKIGGDSRGFIKRYFKG